MGDAENRELPSDATIPLPLRNWQVLEQRATPPTVDLASATIIEIDGEAVVIDVPPSESVDEDAPAATDSTPSDFLTDQLNEQIVVSLDTRQQAIEAGASATYQLTLLNNGPQRAQFTVKLAQSRPALWLSEPLPAVVLRPGERTTVAVVLTPPKAAISRAGEYTLTFVIEADEYPGRQSQLVATLAIAPFWELKLGKLVVPYRTLTWWRRSVSVTAPIINSGNHPVTAILRAQDGANACQITFQAPGIRQARPQQAMVTVAPGRMSPVTLQIYAQSQPWFGRAKRICPIQLTATAKADRKVEQSVLTRITLAPVIGPWQVATLLGLLSFVVIGVGLGGLAVLIAVMVNMTQPAIPVPAVNPAPQPSIVTILLQPAGANPGVGTTATGVIPSADPGVISLIVPHSTQPEVRNPAVPLVQLDQISAPDSGSRLTLIATAVPAVVITQAAMLSATQTLSAAPIQAADVASPQTVAAAAQPAAAQPAAAPSAARAMTYAQMFQEIAMRYDLNWRMLAAQAYVESSFDSLALSNQGALGLMQIMPNTWREWAPTVEVSDPFDSYSNVLVSAVYLDYLRTTLSKQGHSEREWMLVAYNWGPDKVLQYIEGGGTWDELAPELQKYAEEVLRLAETIPPDAAF